MDVDDDRKPSAIPSDGGHSSPDESGAKPKPVLVKDHTARKPKSKHLKWDEEVIEEHDQLRGTRMKIDEPNTPYTHYDSGAESDDSRRPKSPANQKPALSWDVLQNKLDSVAAVREAYPSSPSSHAENSDVEDETKREMQKMEFVEHRKRHYNEMELVRKFRQEHAVDDDVGVDDEVQDDVDDDADDES
jgi:protein phosphatase inhibitor 2